MREEPEQDDESEFLSNPKASENRALLQDIGVIDYIKTLKREILNYKSLLSRGLDIFNRTSIDDIMDATVYQISDHFLPSFIAFLWKPIQTREDITIKAFRNYKPVDIKLRVKCITPFENFFRQNPKPVNFGLLAHDLNNEDAIKPYRQINTEIVIPILGPFGLYSIILVGKKLLGDEYSGDELFYIQQLMSFVSQAIQNHLHYEHSLRDVKTGLYNHGFFLMRLTEEIARTKRNNYQSSIIVMDVDKFKDFNDSFGHLAGDKVLEHLAQMIKQGFRSDDILSRFGGEEFMALLPNTNKLNVWNVAERMRKSIANMQVPWDIPLPKVTISMGIYTFDQNTNADVTSIIRRADEALYISKERGRNCCTMWNPGIIDPHPDSACSIEKVRAHGVPPPPEAL
jgi:diguanylate cyclase (GGDEF)-like protein